jgi:hypothetical protein
VRSYRVQAKVDPRVPLLLLYTARIALEGFSVFGNNPQLTPQKYIKRRRWTDRWKGEVGEDGKVRWKGGKKGSCVEIQRPNNKSSIVVVDVDDDVDGWQEALCV